MIDNLQLCPCLAYLWYPRRLTREPTWAHNHSGRSGSSWYTPTLWSPSLQRLQLQHSHPRMFQTWITIRNCKPGDILLTLSKSFALTMVKCTSVSKAQKKHSWYWRWYLLVKMFWILKQLITHGATLQRASPVFGLFKIALAPHFLEEQRTGILLTTKGRSSHFCKIILSD